MGKNKRKQIVGYDDFHNVNVMFDSVEECDFIAWCSEAAKLKLINDFQYQPESIKLSDSVEYVNVDKKKRVLLREHIYSPDFMLNIRPWVSQKLCKEFKLSLQQFQLESFQVYLDVKGTYQKSDGGRTFSINQKWVHQKTGIYVLKVIPKEFFKACGCPMKCFMTAKTNKPRKMYQGYPSLQDAFADDIAKMKQTTN